MHYRSYVIGKRNRIGVAKSLSQVQRFRSTRITPGYAVLSPRQQVRDTSTHRQNHPDEPFGVDKSARDLSAVAVRELPQLQDWSTFNRIFSQLLENR